MYIVTGGAGFIGSALIAKLNGEGIKDILIVDSLGSGEKWKNLVGKSFTDFVHRKDFLTSSLFKEKTKAIFHMGARSATTELDADFLIENNFRYTKVLAEKALSDGARFVYASSGATYGKGLQGFSDQHSLISSLQPVNMYGFSKYYFDRWAFEQGLLDKIVGLRFFNVYGPNEYHKGSQSSVVLRGYKEIKSSGSLKLFKSHHPDYKDGEQKRDFVYVKDCVEVMWWFLNNSTANGVFNLGTGVARTWNDLANAIFSALGEPPSINYVEMPEELKAHYQNFTEAAMAKLAEAGCPVKPYSLEEGVKDYVQGYLERGLKVL